MNGRAATVPHRLDCHRLSLRRLRRGKDVHLSPTPHRSDRRGSSSDFYSLPASLTPWALAHTTFIRRRNV
jgi:hypothetical protein